MELYYGKLSKRMFPYLLLLPLIATVFAILIFPLCYSFLLSLFSWNLFTLGKEKSLVFLLHYRNALADRYFLKSMQNTFLFVSGTVSMEFGLGFAIALMLSGKLSGRRVINSIILIPMIMTPVVVGLTWRFIYDPSFGILNFLLRSTRWSEGIGWLTNKSIALLSVMIVDIWEMTPFVILVLFAGICAIPTDLIEVAKTDGASYSQIVRYILLPFLRPLILLILLLRTMDTYRIFDTIYVLTRGGPGMATESITMYTYKTGFYKYKMDYAMALSTIIFVIIFAISLLYLFLLRKEI